MILMDYSNYNNYYQKLNNGYQIPSILIGSPDTGHDYPLIKSVPDARSTASRANPPIPNKETKHEKPKRTHSSLYDWTCESSIVKIMDDI